MNKNVLNRYNNIYSKLGNLEQESKIYLANKLNKVNDKLLSLTKDFTYMKLKLSEDIDNFDKGINNILSKNKYSKENNKKIAKKYIELISCEKHKLEKIFYKNIEGINKLSNDNYTQVVTKYNDIILKKEANNNEILSKLNISIFKQKLKIIKNNITKLKNERNLIKYDMSKKFTNEIKAIKQELSFMAQQRKTTHNHLLITINNLKETFDKVIADNDNSNTIFYNNLFSVLEKTCAKAGTVIKNK